MPFTNNAGKFPANNSDIPLTGNNSNTQKPCPSTDFKLEISKRHIKTPSFEIIEPVFKIHIHNDKSPPSVSLWDKILKALKILCSHTTRIPVHKKTEL